MSTAVIYCKNHGIMGKWIHLFFFSLSFLHTGNRVRMGSRYGTVARNYGAVPSRQVHIAGFLSLTYHIEQLLRVQR